jgi:2-methylisocitrate lyase-like PEP mutase family enzyme
MTLKQRLSQDKILLAPGICDALSALIAEQAGAETLYLSGAGLAYTRFGRPDIGLVSMSEVADTIAAVRDRVAVPLVVDADNGFGNALNVQRTVRVFERMGADALQLEDQTLPKRCGHLDGKTLIAASEMAGKIRAACDARASALIIARTDATRHWTGQSFMWRPAPTCCSSRHRDRSTISRQSSRVLATGCR